MKKLLLLLAIILVSCSAEPVKEEQIVQNVKQDSFVINFKKVTTNGLVSIQNGTITYDSNTAIFTTTAPFDAGWNRFELNRSLDSKQLTFQYENTNPNYNISTKGWIDLIDNNTLKIEYQKNNGAKVVKIYAANIN